MHVNELLQRPSTLSPEDVQARIGKLTASRMKDAMDFLKNGQESEKRKQYKFDLIAERMTDILVPHFVTPAMQWGIDNEPAAKLAYSKLAGRNIQQAGFIDHPSIEYCGATPDAYVEGRGLLEVKCPTTQVYLKWALAGVVPEEHKPQMALQMLCTGRTWVDFCAHDPRLPDGKRTFIRKFEPADEYLRSIEDTAIKFLKEVEELFEATTASLT